MVSFEEDIKEAWFFSIREGMHKLGNYLKIGVYSALLVCLEVWGLNILTLISGYMGVNMNSA